MIDYIAEMDKLRFHLSKTEQIQQYLEEGYNIYKIENGKETLLASPEAENIKEQVQDFTQEG